MALDSKKTFVGEIIATVEVFAMFEQYFIWHKFSYLSWIKMKSCESGVYLLIYNYEKESLVSKAQRNFVH